MSPSRDLLKPLIGKGFRVEVVMGMPIGIDLRDPSAADEPGRASRVLDRCFDRLRQADDTFSLWRSDTPMARLSAGTATLSEMPADVVDVLRRCVRAGHVSAGAFTARNPQGRIDPTGLVKGWVVAQVGLLLLDAGYEHWCISAAGDILAHGRPEPGAAWTIGIADPEAPRDILDVVHLGAGGAVATSGTAQRGHHIWDPSGGWASGLRSATVACTRGHDDDMVHADILATAAVVRGRDSIAWLDTLPGVDALLIDDLGDQWCTAGWLMRSVIRADS